MCQDSCEAQDPRHRLPGQEPAEGPHHPRPAAGLPSVSRPHVPAPTLTRRGISRKAHRLGLPANQPPSIRAFHGEGTGWSPLAWPVQIQTSPTVTLLESRRSRTQTLVCLSSGQGPACARLWPRGSPRREDPVSPLPSVPAPGVGVCKGRGAGGYRQGNQTPWEARKSQPGS